MKRKIVIQIDETLAEQLDMVAVADHRSTAAMVRWLIWTAVEGTRPLHGPYQERGPNEPRDTRAGMVYFIAAATGPVKIGFTEGKIAIRLSGLQCGSPVPLVVLGVFAGTRADEAALHKHLAAVRSHGEWFHRGPELDAVMRERLDVPGSVRAGLGGAFPG
jgi:hypothetical protein